MIDKLYCEISLVERHVTVLELVFEHHPIGIETLAAKAGFSSYEVRYSLSLLEDDGLIEPTDRGAVPTANAAGLLDVYERSMADVVIQLEQFEKELKVIA